MWICTVVDSRPLALGRTDQLVFAPCSATITLLEAGVYNDAELMVAITVAQPCLTLFHPCLGINRVFDARALNRPWNIHS